MAVQDEGSSSVTSSSPLQYFSLMSISPTSLAAGSGGSPYTWPREMKSDDRGIILIHLLLNSANYVAAGDVERANTCLEHIALLGASPDGDTMQRIAALFTDALARRLLRASLPGIFRAITGGSTPPSVSAAAAAQHLARRHFFDLCPFLKLAYVIANQAILEAMEGERVVHLVDLHAADPTPWVALMQALSARPGGSPHLRITGVHDQKEVLDHVASRLSEEAEKLDVPFQFNPVVSKLESLDPERSLRVKTGEAVAICSMLQLHRLLAPDDDSGLHLYRTSTATLPSKCSPSGGIAQPHLMAPQMGGHSGTLGELLETEPHHLATRFNGYSPSPDSVVSSAAPPPHSVRMEAFLAGLWGLAPKLMVVVEQESNHNGGALAERFTEALNYYAALFDCLESAAAMGGGGPARAEERARGEGTLFGEEVRDVIAKEGAERRERHERLDRWLKRLEAAGFGRVPLSYYALMQARRLLQQAYGGCNGYGVRDEAGGCHGLCWQDRPLFFVSAWRCRRFD
uniref:Scarecrow-like protein 3 n=1 Tax=Anthurium amnicola TaxID=1678845 RepID=A0A1D1YEG6_9ARAE